MRLRKNKNVRHIYIILILIGITILLLKLLDKGVFNFHKYLENFTPSITENNNTNEKEVDSLTPIISSSINY